MEGKGKRVVEDDGVRDKCEGARARGKIRGEEGGGADGGMAAAEAKEFGDNEVA